MKILQPYYYDDFKCIAGKCKDSCCKGWHIFIDKKSFFKYKNIRGEFGKELSKKIKRRRNKMNDNEYGEMVLSSDIRCSLLNDDNLCNLYINQGKDYLCRTCKIYPRVITKYAPDILERNLMLSCPAVAELLVTMNAPFEFIMRDESPTELDNLSTVVWVWDGYSELYKLFLTTRDLFIDIIQFQEIPLWKRLVFINVAKDRIKDSLESVDNNAIDYKIQAIREYVTNLDNIDLLDDMLEKHTNDKISILLEIILKINEGIEYQNETFDKIINNVIEFVEKEKEIKGFIEKKENEFNEYFKEKELILENYIVHNLYTNYMNSMADSNTDKEINNLIISYSIIKLLLLSVWYSNKFILSNEDIVDILYSYTKVSDHQMKNIYEIIKEVGYDTSFYLSMLIY